MKSFKELLEKIIPGPVATVLM